MGQCRYLSNHRVLSPKKSDWLVLWLAGAASLPPLVETSNYHPQQNRQLSQNLQCWVGILRYYGMCNIWYCFSFTCLSFQICYSLFVCFFAWFHFDLFDEMFKWHLKVTANLYVIPFFCPNKSMFTISPEHRQII